MYVHAGLWSHIHLHFIGAGVCVCYCICPHIFGCVVHFCILKVRTRLCLCVSRCGWMLILQQASVTEQSSAWGSNRSCWVSVNRLMKITAPVICIVTNIQFRWSGGGGVTHWHWAITKHRVKTSVFESRYCHPGGASSEEADFSLKYQELFNAPLMQLFPTKEWLEFVSTGLSCQPSTASWISFCTAGKDWYKGHPKVFRCCIAFPKHHILHFLYFCTK